MNQFVRIEKESDLWETPRVLFLKLCNIFNFNIDLCCNNDNCLLSDQEVLPSFDYLKTDISKLQWDFFREWDFWPQVAFMNPPYSKKTKDKPGIEDFLKKAWQDSKHMKIVCLVPVSVLANKYMDDIFFDSDPMPFRVEPAGLVIRHFRRRVKFNHPTKKASSPAFSCCLLIMDRRGYE